jgi:hypothetical protein
MTPCTVSPDLQTKIIKLGILRSCIFRTAAEFKRLSAEIKATRAESVEVKS